LPTRHDYTLTDTKGKVKEGVGDLTGDQDVKNEGIADQAQGKLEKGLGDVQDTLQDAGDRVKEEVDRHR